MSKTADTAVTPVKTLTASSCKQLPAVRSQTLPAPIDVRPSVGSLEAYIRWANQIPLLSPEEEYELATNFQTHQDWQSARKLVLAHLRFVIHVSKQYYGYGLPQSDLIQEGNIGLMKAVQRYDPERGVRLVSYALPWIKSEMYEFIMRNLRTVRIPKTKSQLKCLKKLSQEPRQKALSQQQVQDYAQELEVTPDTLRLMEVFLSGYDEPFEAPSNSDDEQNRWSPSQYLIAEQGNHDGLIAEDWASHRTQQLQTALGQLDERSRDIIESRWLTDEKQTLDTIANTYGVSTQRIQQLEKAALKKLKVALAEAYESGDLTEE